MIGTRNLGIKISFETRNLTILNSWEILKKMVSIENNVIFAEKHESFCIFRWRCWFAFLENIYCPVSWRNLALSHLNIFGDNNHPMDITQLSKDNFLKKNCFRKNYRKCRKMWHIETIGQLECKSPSFDSKLIDWHSVLIWIQ